RLARSGRPAEQEVVPACSGELQRTPPALLAANVEKIECRRRRDGAVRRDVRLELELAAQVARRIGEVPDGNRLHPGERRLTARVRWAKDLGQTDAACALGNGQHSADAPNPPVQGELADGCMLGQPREQNLAGPC